MKHSKELPDGENPYIEDFFTPDPGGRQYPRTRRDAEFGVAQNFSQELRDTSNIVGLARHEPPPDQPPEDLSALPESPQGEDRLTAGDKIAGLLEKFTRH